jgi:hypothetical protein
MKTRYLALLATLAFLGFSVLAAAHDCSRHAEDDKDHKHCINDSGPDATYTVVVDILNPTTTWCTGQAERNLSVGIFEEDAPCKITLGTQDLCLVAVGVKNTPNETGVQYVFNDSCSAGGGSGDAWNTIRLPASVVINEEPAPDFIITADEPAEAQLRKKTQPGKGEPLPGTITVGPLTYTADPL